MNKKDISAAAAAAAAGQPTPFNLNRYVLLLVYMFYIFSTGCVYFGWSALSKLLFTARLFSHRCVPPLSTEEAAAAAGAPLCAAQESAVHKLFTITLAAHFSSGLVVGLLLDRGGPLKTAIVGQILGLSGWGFLASLHPNSNLSPVAAFVLIGFAVDASLLPSIGISNLFPKSKGFVMALTGSAASASMLIPVLLRRLSNGSLSCLWIYVGCGPAACLLLSPFIIPKRPFKTQQDFEKEILLQLAAEQQKETPQNDETVMPVCDVKETGDCPPAAAAETDPSTTSSSSSNSSSNDSSSSSDGDTKPFWSFLVSPTYVLLVLYFVGSAAISSFFQQVCQRLFSQSVVCTLELLLPFEFVFSLPLGALADAFGVLAILLLLNCCGCLLYVCTYLSPSVFGYLAVVCFTAYSSMFLTPIFLYLQTNFPLNTFGRLAGITTMLGGCTSLACNPLLDLVVFGNSQQLQLAKALMLSITLLQFVWIGCLLLRERKKQANRDTRTFADTSCLDAGLPKRGP